MISIHQKVALAFIIFLSYLCNDLAWGSGYKDTIFTNQDAIPFEFIGRWQTPILPSTYSFGLWGPLVAGFVLILMVLYDLLPATAILSTDADNEYMSNICNYVIAINAVTDAYELTQLAGMLGISLVLELFYVYAMHEWYNYVHTRQLQFWLQLTTSLLYTWCVFGTVNVFVALMGFSALPSFMVLGFCYFLLLELAYHNQDWILAAGVFWILLGIVARQTGLDQTLFG